MTPISEFRDPIRAFLLDAHPTIKKFHADQVDAAVRLVVNLGKAPGVQVAGDGLNLTPSVSPTSEVAEERLNWGRIVLHSAKRFVMGNSASFSYRTRALSESFGEQREAVFDILNEAYAHEFGEGGE